MMPESVQNFIREHLNDELPRLLLSAHRYPGIPVSQAVAQIEALRKVRTKIPSWFRFDLEFPPLISVEQASSEQSARFKAGLFGGQRMLDLTGGMGIDAYFFAQRFQQVTYVERQPVTADCARRNFEALQARNIQVECLDAEVFLQSRTASFDLIYLDPARRDGLNRRVFRLDECEPDVLSLRDRLLQATPRLLLKTAPLLDLSQAVEQLGSVTRVWVVALDNEVKEVLYLLEPTGTPAPADIPVEAVSLGDPDRHFQFTRAEEQAAHPGWSAPLQFLYEPDAAILKAGAFKTFAERFGLAKLHPNTHLYTSDRLVPGVPGRSFRVEAVLKYDRKALRAVLPEGRANVAVRNFPDTVELVRKKLDLKDGGDRYLFGAGGPGGPVLVLGRKT